MRWWEEHQLRILVLGSLFLQFVLFIGSMTRHVRALKSCMWLAYLGSDALAIYALSTLFNRHKVPASSSTVQLEALWAPVLLHHLGGGLHAFNAYSIEDNELWRRHLVTLVSQVTVALYVFCKAWSGGDKKLLQAEILLFIAGIIKFIHKLILLKSASFSSMISSSAVYPRRRRVKDSCFLALCFTQTSISRHDAVALRKEEEHDLSVEAYIQRAKELARAPEVNHRTSSYYKTEEKRFVDLSVPYSRRLGDMASFLKDKDTVPLLEGELGTSFGMIYNNVVSSYSTLLFIICIPSISLASAVLFGQSNKGDYTESDIKVTYIFLWCMTALEFLSPIFGYTFGRIIWSITAAQHNLVSFTARKIRPTKLMRVLTPMCFKEYINEHWYISQESSSTCNAVIQLVVKHLKDDGWNQFIVDAKSYKRFNNFRGQLTMSRHKVRDPDMLSSLQLPFDISVLVWHLATELCLHHPKISPSPTTNVAAQESSARTCSNVISDYMIYLLLIHPEMLMLGSRPGLFTATCDHIEIMLNSVGEPPSRHKRTVVERILRAAGSPEPYCKDTGPWILKACKLAENLMEMPDEEQRWKLIQGVWIEMLCYSAGRCTGYLHSRA